jgi:hypothetical protein
VTEASYYEAPQTVSPQFALLGHGMVGLMVFLGAFVFSEPAPYELAGIGVISVAFLFGMTIPRQILPMLYLLLFICLGGMVAMFMANDTGKAIMYVAVTGFLAGSSLFFSCYIPPNPQARMRLIMVAYVFAGLSAAIAGIMGYFDIAGTGELFSLYGRARGTFQDPNVLGPFLILPSVWCVYILLTRQLLAQTAATFALLFLSAGLFLSFSRGAWGHYSFSVLVTVALLFFLDPRPHIRLRVLSGSIFGALFLTLLIAIAFSIPEISSLAEQRLSLTQSYDTGHLGRFGRHILGFLLALEKPFGIGALEFQKYFPEDPHNVYLNTLMSYGWMGFFAYVSLILLTLKKLIDSILQIPHLREYTIPVFATLLGLSFLGMIIDTDHWRHFYLVLGVAWGLVAASERYKSQLASSYMTR